MKLQLTLLATFVAFVAAQQVNWQPSQPFDWTFEQFDLDKNHLMNESELTKQFDTLVKAANDVYSVSMLLQINGRQPDKLAKDALENFDADKSDNLDITEWKKLAHYVVNFNVKPSAGMQKIFNEFDKNKDTMLDRGELEHSFDVIIKDVKSGNGKNKKALEEIESKTSKQLSNDALLYFDVGKKDDKLNYTEYIPLAHYVEHILKGKDDSYMNMAFDRYDKNKNNAWNYQEVEQSFKGLIDLATKHNSKVVLNEIGNKNAGYWASFAMARLDLDKNQQLSKFEWIPLALYIKHMTSVTVQTEIAGWVWEFNQLDLNNNGVMEGNELDEQFAKLITAAKVTKSVSLLIQIRGRSAMELTNEALKNFDTPPKDNELNLKEWILLADYITDHNDKPGSELMKTFKMIDTSKDNFLQKEELAASFKEIIPNVKNKKAIKEIQEIIKVYANQKNNTQAIEEIKKEGGNDEWYLAYIAIQHFDRNMDGQLTYLEYIPLAKYVEHFLLGDNNNIVIKTFEMFDNDHDDAWNKKEAKRYIETLHIMAKKNKMTKVLRSIGDANIDHLVTLAMDYYDHNQDGKLTKIEGIQLGFYLYKQFEDMKKDEDKNFEDNLYKQLLAIQAQFGTKSKRSRQKRNRGRN